jgi:hypothetical protein
MPPNTLIDWNVSNQPDSNDWQTFFSGSQLDRETQALLDNILQPHLSIGFPMGDWNEGQARFF